MIDFERRSTSQEILETNFFLFLNSVKNDSAEQFEKNKRVSWFYYSCSDYEAVLRLAAEICRLEIVKI